MRVNPALAMRDEQPYVASNFSCENKTRLAHFVLHLAPCLGLWVPCRKACKRLQRDAKLLLFFGKDAMYFS